MSKQAGDYKPGSHLFRRVNSMKYQPSIGGHAPHVLRDTLCEWIDQEWEEATEIEGEQRTIEWLIGQLWNCTDILPGESCDELGIPQGSTYGQAARHIQESQSSAKSGQA